MADEFESIGPDSQLDTPVLSKNTCLEMTEELILPTEILARVISYLPVSDVVMCRLVRECVL